MIRRVNVICECGVKKEVGLSSLRQSETKSCGCYHRDTLTIGIKTHGEAKSGFYGIYRDIRARCERVNCRIYKHYGGRGIVCEWPTFESFRDDMKEGYSENLTIERNDVNGNYCKSNCRWATMAEQGRNKRNTPRYNGISLAQYCEENNINYSMVSARIYKLKWSINDAVSTPKKVKMFLK